jgi:hypothetical protein
VQRRANVAGLTDRQAKLVQGLIQGMSIPEASIHAGYSHETAGYQALDSSAVQRALHDYRVRVIQTEGATLGMRTLIDLCASSVPAGTRYKAAVKLLELAGHVTEAAGDTDDTPLHEMTPAQLREVVAKMQKIVAEGGDLPVVRLVGADSAQPGHNGSGGGEE